MKKITFFVSSFIYIILTLKSEGVFAIGDPAFERLNLVSFRSTLPPVSSSPADIATLVSTAL